MLTCLAAMLIALIVTEVSKAIITKQFNILDNISQPKYAAIFISSYMVVQFLLVLKIIEKL